MTIENGMACRFIKNRAYGSYTILYRNDGYSFENFKQNSGKIFHHIKRK